ncbi:hypothetical protein BBP40_001352 [Aspergillus hancockii]|nr:hypothetical protein BBP40_001352 [Aspergillus hancockii]
MYGQDLKESIAALKLVERADEREINSGVSFGEGTGYFNRETRETRRIVNHYQGQIVESLSRGDPRYVWLKQSNIWPCVNPTSILQQLRSTARRTFGPSMEEAFILYGLAISKLQRLNRLKEAFGKGDKERLHQEYNNDSHVNWKPSEYPDWLLLEIDADMRIREEQVTVALEMISPSSGSNSALQMNMGQGKTSVIMPMVASILADGKMLTRLLVPKALLSQTAQVLQSRLGGLLGREVTHIPFSRRTPTTPQLINEYQKLHKDMMLNSGIILGIPEHVLSFKLSGLQKIADRKIDEASAMVLVQRWLDRICRDILDECDFTLAVKTQLIYPSGSQLTVDGHPDRWEVTMGVLGLVARHIHDLAYKFPQSIDVVAGTVTGFPVAYFLRKDVEEALTEKIAGDICYGRTPILDVRDCTNEELDAIRIFISREIVNRSVAKTVSRLFSDAPKAKKSLYLLRGLIAHGILLLCLKKRWNVQYGLHPHRDPMAVPFHAKGVPSDHAEWGHPDVAILFTCLSFYHHGLSEEQLRQSLQEVLRSDDPAIEYDRWTQTSRTLPEPLRHWNTINADDAGQIAELWRHLRMKIVVINHYLKSFVFPVHAKQFSVKLQASGWDIPLYTDTPLYPSAARFRGPGLTTGFSGTNDNRRLLPLTIEQQDLPGLSHTNAEVLTYLLQKRNRRYQKAANQDGTRFSELDLLAYLKEKGIRILIDAGAFVLEMDNQTLVRAWLQDNDQAQAAVFFRQDNQPWVQYKTGKYVSLLSTPFADNMENCLVYLDEAHTRGTDLKLPPGARGALTLGLNQTKDHTVQAAMRLRQLGTTQSVTFIAPPEVHQSILDVRRKTGHDKLDSSDVIIWLLDQTCNSNQELQSLYFSQGADFCHRMQVAASHKHYLSNPSRSDEYIEQLQQPEQHTLEQLYEPRLHKRRDVIFSETAASMPFGGRLTSFMERLRQDFERSHIESSISSSALEEVEQEREVAYEIEEEREIQRPPLMKVHRFTGLHRSILNFVMTGELQGNAGYMKAATVLESTVLAQKYGIDATMMLRDLYVSTEFTKTVKLKPGKKNDNFMRPVNWLLWDMQTQTCLVIIPEEAEVLIPILRTIPSSSVHLILYAAAFTKKMLHFDKLNYYTLPILPEGWAPPPWLPFELGILAGRLYFEFTDYDYLSERLQLNLDDKAPTAPPAQDSETVPKTTQSANLSFLREWLTLRRQGQDISHTPMGYVCQGWRLRNDHPFFLSRKAAEESDGTDRNMFNTTSYRVHAQPDDDYYDSDDDEIVEMVDDEQDAGEYTGEDMEDDANMYDQD